MRLESANPGLALAIGLVVVVAGFFDAPDASARPNGQAAPVPVEFPLQDWHGRPVVDLHVDGQGPFRFLLDTGADITILDWSLAERLSLPTDGETEIGSPLGGTVPAGEVKLPAVAIGGLAIGDLLALAIDLAGMLGSDGPVGILSSRAFTGKSLVIDYPGEEIRVGDELLPPADGREVFDFCDAEGKPSLTVDLAGASHCVHLDTGSPSLLVLPLATAERLPLASPPEESGRAVLVGSEMKLSSARLRGELRIGTVAIRDPELGFLETAPYGILGQEFLQNVELTVDHENSRLRIRPSAKNGGSPAPEEDGARRVVRSKGKKRYGIRFPGIGGEELAVLGVESGSPAEIAGLRDGDRIVAMNGKPVAELAMGDRIAALQGTPLTLRIDRSGEELELTLSLD